MVNTAGLIGEQFQVEVSGDFDEVNPPSKRADHPIRMRFVKGQTIPVSQAIAFGLVGAPELLPGEDVFTTKGADAGDGDSLPAADIPAKDGEANDSDGAGEPTDGAAGSGEEEPTEENTAPGAPAVGTKSRKSAQSAISADITQSSAGDSSGAPSPTGAATNTEGTANSEGKPAG